MTSGIKKLLLIVLYLVILETIWASSQYLGCQQSGKRASNIYLGCDDQATIPNLRHGITMANFSYESCKYITPLMMASMSGNIKLVSDLIKANADVNATSSTGRTPLMYAVSSSSHNILGIAKVLLAAPNICLDQLDDMGNAAIFYAIINQNPLRVEALKLLLTHSPNLHNVHNWTDDFLLVLTRLKKFELFEIVLDYLKRHPEKCHLADTGSNELALLAYVRFNCRVDTQIVQKLVDLRADSNQWHEYGKTALGYLVEIGQVDAFEVLVKAGVIGCMSIYSANQLARKLLKMARSLPKMIEILLPHLDAFSLNLEYDNGSTLLIQTIRLGFLEIFAQMLQLPKVGLTRSAVVAAAQKGEAWFALIVKRINQQSRDRRLINCALFTACEAGYLAQVKVLLGAAANRTINYELDASLLRLAISKGHASIVEYLAANQGNINYKDFEGRTALLLACKQQNYRIADILIGNKANPGIHSCKGRTALYYAARFSSNLVKKLLASMAQHQINVDSEVNFITHNSHTSVLMEAAKNGKLKVVKMLISRNAIVDMHNSLSETALYLAIKKGSVSVTKYLLEKKADANTMDCFGTTPLFLACNQCPLMFITLLGTSNSFQLGYTNKLLLETNRSLMICAAIQGNCKAIGQLVQRKFDPFEYAKGQKSLLHFACEYGNLATVRYLVDQLGFQKFVNMQTIRGKTPLIAATKQGNWEIVNYLLAQKASCNLTNTDGSTALYFACKLKHFSIAYQLVHRGASTASKNQKARTPLTVAYNSQDTALFRLIYEHDNGEGIADLNIDIFNLSSSFRRALLYPPHFGLLHNYVKKYLLNYYEFSKRLLYIDGCSVAQALDCILTRYFASTVTQLTNTIGKEYKFLFLKIFFACIPAYLEARRAHHHKEANPPHFISHHTQTVNHLVEQMLDIIFDTEEHQPDVFQQIAADFSGNQFCAEREERREYKYFENLIIRYPFIIADLLRYEPVSTITILFSQCKI